ncbi:MAG: acyl-CoA dehydrogenase family protein [Rhizomicrobium sp.]
MSPFLSADGEKFRGEARAFIEQRYPTNLREKREGDVLSKQDYLAWHRILAVKGWIAPAWPEEYGGANWSLERRYIWQDELARADTISLPPMGIGMLGPVIYTFGTSVQKDQFLAPTLAGDIFWCQGYSEPQAGSDLASVSMKAVRVGDRYVVTGQKMWTSLAQYADWIFCLVRTDPDSQKQAGISFLLIDMRSPGIAIKPIQTLGGDLLVNEVWFDEVDVPVANRINDENRGWACAKFLLGLERTGIANVARSKRKLVKLKETARQCADGDQSIFEDHQFREKLAEVEIALTALEYSELRIFAEEASGGQSGASASLLKVRGTEIQQRLAELFAEAAGYAGCPAAAGNLHGANAQGRYRAFENYFSSRRTSIYGGTNEVQRNIMAKAVLGF